MAIAYTPPGVSVNETTTTSVSPLITSSADICLVGLAGNKSSGQTPITTTDTMILSGTATHVLPTLANINNDAVLVGVSKVTNVLDPSVGSPPGSGYALTTDYTIHTGEAGPDGTNGTIARVDHVGGIPDGGLVQVTYTYLPSDYWNPIRLFDIGSVETRFGPSWDTATSNGQTYYIGIKSQLSFAARIAFENGAQSVICQPLFVRATPGDPTTAQQAPDPTTDVGDAATWADTLYVLRPIVDIDTIVPIVGQDGTTVTDSGMLNIFAAVQAHIAYMNQQQQYICGIFGEDGTATAAEASSLITTVRNNHAIYLQSSYANNLSSQCALINNTVFQRQTPGGNNTTIDVGGQYFAAAVAGALASRPVSQSLTRSSISGFVGITDPRVPSDKNSDAGSGLMVVEQISGGAIRVRQGNTLDVSHGPARSELSVVRSKFVMMESIQQTLDSQIIGKIIADANSPLIVRSTVSGVLGLLQGAGTIVGYANVTAALTSLNPTTITVSFSYQPAFPLNYIKVTFAIDLTSNTITIISDGTGATNAST